MESTINGARASRFVVGFFCLMLASCGSSGRKTVYHAHGQAFDSQNHPCAGAFIVLHPVDPADTDSAKPYAYVDDDGTFELTTYEQGDGAAPGEYVATIIWKPRVTSAMDPNRKAPDKLAGRYSKPAEFMQDGKLLEEAMKFVDSLKK